MPEQLSSYLPSVVALVVVVLSYFFGRRQAEHERLYERRAEVIVGMYERYEDLDQRLHSLVS